MVRDMMAMEAKFAAGPAMRRTNAAPGERPLSISERAMGIDPVAQTYIGTAMATIASMARSGRSPSASKKFSGTKRVMSAAMMRPTISHLPMLATMVWKPYTNVSLSLAANDFGRSSSMAAEMSQAPD